MIRVSELSGAWLDYWVARADGIPAEDLQVRQIQRSEGFHCVHGMPLPIPGGVFRKVRVLNYSTSWELCGPLVDLHRIELERFPSGKVAAHIRKWDGAWTYVAGAHQEDDARVAICRAVVTMAFGEKVPEVTP